MTEFQRQFALKKLRKWLETAAQAAVAKKLGYTQAYISQTVNEKIEMSDAFRASLLRHV